MVVGYVRPLALHFTGSETAAAVVFAVILVAVLAAYIDGKVRCVEGLCLLLLTVLTSVMEDPEVGSVLPAVGSFLLAAAVLAVAIVVIERVARKKARGDTST